MRTVSGGTAEVPVKSSPVQPISVKHHHFPPEVIRYAVWLYFRFTLSLRDVEKLLAQRGIVVSREAIRMWVNKFSPLIAATCAATGCTLNPNTYDVAFVGTPIQLRRASCFPPAGWR